jgi:hypothetical protein
MIRLRTIIEFVHAVIKMLLKMSTMFVLACPAFIEENTCRRIYEYWPNIYKLKSIMTCKSTSLVNIITQFLCYAYMRSDTIIVKQSYICFSASYVDIVYVSSACFGGYKHVYVYSQ